MTGYEVTEKEFCLLKEPWIRVLTPECDLMEVSLKEALLNAHKYAGLGGEMPAQDVAVLRLLVAVVHTVFTRWNTHGHRSSVQDEDEAINRWKELWDMSQFPTDVLEAYLDQWEDRFWLFHPERPFYQVPSAQNGTENSVAKLNGEVSESNNKARLFSMVAGKGKERMTYAEAARWLMFMNGYDDCAAKQRDKSDGSRSVTVGWLGKIGLVLAQGTNLFETIMLNMVMLDGNGQLWEDDDHPVWEAEKLREKERQIITMPNDLSGLFTLQSRRILLRRQDNHVVGYALLGGDAFDDMNAVNEPMTLWKYDEDKKTKVGFYRPRRHERIRQIWRDFELMTENEDSYRRPGVVEWCGLLRRDHVLSRSKLVTFRTVCVRYDSSQSSSITDSFLDSLTFHIDLLSEIGKDWRKQAVNQIGKINEVANKCWELALNLCAATGQEGDNAKQQASEAKERLYEELDLPFRAWLSSLNPEQTVKERQQSISQWEYEVRTCALRLGQEMANDKGDVAFIGRSIEDKKKKVSRHYSSPEAIKWYRNGINTIYPLTRKGESENG